MPVEKQFENDVTQPCSLIAHELLYPGSRLEKDRYHIVERIGAGSMGVVFAAFDSVLARDVAIKFLTDTCGRPVREAESQFLGEAQAMARVNNENVVAVHDVGWFCEQMFIIMERVNGESLTEWHKRAPRPVRLVCALLRQALSGLAAIHRCGLIHGDIKPDNILVALDRRQDRTEWQLKIADFGLSFGREQSGHGQHFLGSLDYMAPEQLTMPRQPAGISTDIYACAVVFYELLYGVRPFLENTENPLERDLHELSPMLRRRAPESVYQALVKGLSPEPAARHLSMEAFASALDAKSGPIARPRATCQRARRATSSPMIVCGQRRS